MEDLRAALRGVLGPKVGIGVTDPALGGDLLAEEACAVATAVPKRQIEFAAGRRAARAALAEIGVPTVAVPQGPDRAPVWPDRVIGSISHCATCCIAAVMWQADTETLGIDVEPATALDPDLTDVVCTPAERAWAAAQPDPGLAAKTIFSAKESIYKAQYPLTGQVIGFDAVAVAITDTYFETAATATLPQLKGRVLIRAGLILTVAYA